MNGFRLVSGAFLEAAGTIAYIYLLSWLVDGRFGLFGQATRIGSSAFWLLSLLSAAAAFFMLIAAPMRLHAQGAWQEAIFLFCFSIAWLVLFVIIGLSGLLSL